MTSFTKTTIEVKGYNLIGLIKKLQKIAFCTIIFSVLKKDLQKTFAILENMCYTYIIRSMSTREFFKKLLVRIAIPISLALAIIGIVIAQNLVFATDTNLVGVKASQVQSLMRSLGARVGALKNSVPLAKIKAELLKLDFVADCSVYIKGNKVIAYCTQRTQQTEHAKKADAIVSDYDGVIRSIVVNCGTAKVRVGDVVKRGDVLIEGVEYSTDGQPLVDSGAKGEIFADVTFAEKSIVAKTTFRFVETGKIAQKTYATVFSPVPAKSPFEYYRKQVTQSKFTIFLPIKIITVKYHELKKQSFDTDLQKTANEKLHELCINKGCVGEQTGYDVTETDDYYTLTVWARARMSIGKEINGTTNGN